MPTHEIAWSPDLDLVPLLTTTGLTSSNSEARRLIRQGVRVNSKQVNSSYKFAKADSYILQVGKRRFVRLILK